MKTEKLFERYGKSAVYTVIGQQRQITEFKAFVQPLRYKNKLYLRGKYTEIGKNKEDYYLYIGPPQIDVSAVDGIFTLLEIDGTGYLVYRTEKHSIGEKDIYIWAIIRPIVEDNETDDDLPSSGGGAVG